MSFTAQPAADLRLVRPEHGGPGNNERLVSVLNKQSDSFPSPLQKSNRICTICRNGPRQSGGSRCSICSILATPLDSNIARRTARTTTSTSHDWTRHKMTTYTTVAATAATNQATIFTSLAIPLCRWSPRAGARP